MEFAVLGPILVDGRAPPGGKERALLARLLVAPGTPVSVEQLIEAGWPPEQREGAARSLHVRLTKLRGLVEPGRAPGAPSEVLVREPAGYRLAVAPAHVDAHRFALLADRAGGLAADAALDCCEQALGLWRGEPFDELDTVEAAAAEARRLRAVRDRVRHTRALALGRAGRADESAAELARLVEDDPLREELVRDLMLALYRSGRHVEALDGYRALSERLGELGLSPGPQVRELESLVLRHADELAAEARPSMTDAVPAPTPSSSVHPTNVGAPVASVVGREDALEQVARALEEHRIVTLVGPGGVGKTTLALQVARSRLETTPGGAWLVELNALRDAAAVIPAAATALGLRRIGGETGDEDVLAVLRERLRDARLTVVLDNAEHLLPALAPVAQELAQAGAGVTLLVTSRRPLGLAGEAVVPVAPLELPAEDADLDALDASPAGRLFLERARAARTGWRPDVGDAVAIARICRRLDGLPLALELAAGRLRALSATAIAERLDDGLAVLGQGTLDASIEASHALLSPAEQELFRRLSIFESPFELEDAERVGADADLPEGGILDLLVALTEHSMVQVEGESPRRYRLLEALRADGRARLTGAAGVAAAHRHAVHFAQLAATAAQLVYTVGTEAAGDPLIPRRSDLEAAFEHAIEGRETDLALDLATGLEALHHRLGTVALGVAQGARALALPGGSPDRRIEALIWHFAQLLCELDLPAMRATLADLRALVHEHGDVRAVSGVRVWTASLALCEGDLATAQTELNGLHAATIALGDHFSAGQVACLEGAVAMTQGAIEEAIPRIAAGRDTFAALGDVCALDSATADLAEAEVLCGRVADATVACEHAFSFGLERPLGERNTHLLHETALAAVRAGEVERAAELARAAATAARRDPVRLGRWHAPAAAGDLALASGQPEVARERFEHARGIAERVREEMGPSLPVEARVAVSELRLAQAAGDPAGALEHARGAFEHAQASGAPGLIGATGAAVEALEAAAAPEPASPAGP